jgi:hypothetical protein
VKGNVWKSQLTIVKSEKGFGTLQILCPFIVSTSKFTQIDEVHKLLGELLKGAMLKVSHLEAKKVNMIGMKFNMQYLKSTALEVHDYVTHGKCELQVLDCEINLSENKVFQFCVGCACFNF